MLGPHLEPPAGKGVSFCAEDQTPWSLWTRVAGGLFLLPFAALLLAYAWLISPSLPWGIATLLWAGVVLHLYDWTLAYLGLAWSRCPPPPREGRPSTRFAVLIPAHNEELVIGPLLDSLERQDYPKELFKVYVAADRCTDGTVAEALKRGAVVLERWEGIPGKTWNIRSALERIDLSQFDALVIVDADNLVSPGFLLAMDAYLRSHPEVEVVQGYLDVKNPNDTWVTRALALSYWYTNPFWQEARGRLGLSASPGSTGMVIRTSHLLAEGWYPRSLTEDLEIHARLVLRGSRAAWNPYARVYDEKPRDLRTAYRQRLRWMRGHTYLLVTLGPRMLGQLLGRGKTFRERLLLLDTFLHLLFPLRTLLLELVVLYLVARMLLWYFQGEMGREGLLLSLAGPGLVLLARAAWGLRACFGRIPLAWLAHFWTPLPFNLVWLPATFLALLSFRRQDLWRRTPHTALVRIEDLEGQERGR